MTQPRRILKRSTNRMIGGVCGGIAEYLGWPVIRVRILYVLASILSVAFPGILVYIILWFVLPPPDYEPPGSFDLKDFRKQ